MAKSDFICKNCREVKSKPFISLKTFRKYQCPNCGTLCGECVGTGVIKASRCRKCGAKVLTYQWDNDKSKWDKC